MLEGFANAPGMGWRRHPPAPCIPPATTYMSPLPPTPLTPNPHPHPHPHPHRVRYLETAAGHQWLAQRIPDGSFFVSANQGRFQTVDLNDTQNVLASPGLLDFALENGLWDPDSGEPFNFAKAFHEDSAVDRPASCEECQWEG